MSDVAAAIYVMAGVHLFEFLAGWYLSWRRSIKVHRENEKTLKQASEIGQDSVFAALQKSKILLEGSLVREPK